MQVTAEIKDKYRVQRGYFTPEQMNLLKQVHYTSLQKSAKANSAHALTPKAPAPEKPPENATAPSQPPPTCAVTTAAQEKPQAAANAKPRATKKPRKPA